MISNDSMPQPLGDSLYARERQTRFARLRFSPGLEPEFDRYRLQRARGRLRAWHTTVLVVLLASVLPSLISTASGGEGTGIFADTWHGANAQLALYAVVASTVSRLLLAAIAWSPWLERLYPKVAFPLVAICHACWTFTCSGEILGSHPEYVAPLVTDAFAAYFFSGLPFRQALFVNIAAVAGLLFGAWRHSGVWTPILSAGTHLFMNMIMAAIAGFAHERATRSEFLERSMLGEMAARDGLTSLRNRRAFDAHLTSLWQQALRDRRSLGILMIDVDRFKHYNDCYGHQAGDNALQRIAATVDDFAKRPLDVAARYGGEELALILYDLPREHVVDVAGRLQRAVQSLDIEHIDSPAGTVTVSIGVAVVRPKPGRSPQGGLQLADQALYEAKRNGRNRVHVLEQEYDSLSTGVFAAAASRR